jgi:hypothetical protein
MRLQHWCSSAMPHELESRNHGRMRMVLRASVGLEPTHEQRDDLSVRSRAEQPTDWKSAID